jgi:5-methylcytosine-specific restriction endonuclease McrA
VYAALTSEADRLKSRGDARSRGQIMADTIVDRVLGAAGATPSVTLNVVVNDDVLWGESGAAHLDGYGPVPGDLVRELAGSARAWVRRLYARPETGSLVAMDSHRRLLPQGLARLIRLRDRVCRTPWCGAPIRHGDHVTAAEEGGETTDINSQGLCVACNHAKQAPGWRARSSPGERHRVETTTPTGHRYASTAPPAITPLFVETRPGLWTLVA